MKIPRFLLTAGASGSGKTLVTCGILQAFKNRGLDVVSFKCGPDYIDPMFHAKVIGTKSANLDTFFTNEETTRYLLTENAKDADIAVMEGVMGYYDGVGGITTKASAYDLAKVTDTPAVLLINCKGMSVSILPYVQGFVKYQKDSHIEGVLLNQMSPMLYPRVKKLIEEELHVPVYGYVPRVEECRLESRHLGLVLPDEVVELKEKLNRLAEVLEKTVDLDGLLKLGNSALDLKVQTPDFLKQVEKKRQKKQCVLAWQRTKPSAFYIRTTWNFWKKWVEKSVIFLLFTTHIFRQIWTVFCSVEVILSFLEKSWKKENP